MLSPVYGDFLKFETVTLFPIDKKLIDLKLLTNLEIDWINQYHQEVEDQLLPLLKKDEKKWLEEKCREIGWFFFQWLSVTGKISFLIKECGKNKLTISSASFALASHPQAVH